MEWIKTTERTPPIGAVVRVAWSPSSPSDRKTAIWDGRYWWTARRSGIFHESPAYWLDVHAVPPIPTN